MSKHDIVLADDDGVLFIPSKNIEETFSAAFAIAKMERDRLMPLEGEGNSATNSSSTIT